MTASTAGLLPTEDEAAALEGVLPMPADLVALRAEKLALDAEVDRLSARKEEIKAEFARRLQADSAQGYVLDGKVHARRSEVTSTRIDGGRLKEVMPHVWRQFVKTTRSVRITIN